MGLTKEQQLAVESSGKNIIVSAGAGSGKTFVLTERVKYLLLHGVSLSQLLLLTFTNAAAAEMKSRIRKMILKTPELSSQLDLLEGAYITTFDSFALSIVKKYHTRLNLTNQIEVCDEVLIDLKKKEILNTILEEHYRSPSDDFLKLIEDFCLKDDQVLRDLLLSAYQKIELKVDKKEYFQNVLTEDKIQEMISSTLEDYCGILKSRQKDLIRLMGDLNTYFDGDFVSKVEDNFAALMEANTYLEFVQACHYSSLRVPNGTSLEGKKLKSDIFDLAKDIEKYCVYSSLSEMEEEYRSTLGYQGVLFSILKDFDQRLSQYKRENQLFTFTDISSYAIEVVRKNPDVLKELRDQFQEIMVDEYQDTSDTQEIFIQLISHQNIYMVGDIKQSIYRFRNANPDLFQQKYSSYQDPQQGLKIDLLKNFRSREEVLEDINLLFDHFMDEEIGGANYQESHRMIFGQEDYSTLGKTNLNHHMEFLLYDEKNLLNLSKEEEEAFLIASDIKKKIQENYLVWDKEEKFLRPLLYQDIVVLLDKSKNFTLFKRIFESCQIPLTIVKEESFRKEEDSLVFRNLFRFLICIHEKCFDLEFRYTFVSLCRSFLWKMSDEDIYEIYQKNSFFDTDFYRLGEELAEKIDTMSLSQFFSLVLEKYHYDEKLLTVGNISSYRVRSEYFYQLCQKYEEMGNTIYDFVEYLNQIFDGDYDLKFNVQKTIPNSCQIMTIHKSKGLEYPICYYAGLTSKFSEKEMKERMIFDSHYGFILPKVDHSYKDIYLKFLYKHLYHREELSERIRLFYVALTRAREKMIFVLPKQEEELERDSFVPTYEREKYSSFLSILKSIWSIILPYTKELEILGNKEYLKTMKKNEYSTSFKDSLKVEELSLENTMIEENHFSKNHLTLLDYEEKEKMQVGTQIHEILENLDFENADLSSLSIPNYWKEKILHFLESDFMKERIHYPMRKEWEFVDVQENEMLHGVIDLLIDEGESYTIIDYKLKGIDDSAYDEQLNGYRHSIEKKTQKKVRCYLYSLFEEEYREVKDA